MFARLYQNAVIQKPKAILTLLIFCIGLISVARILPLVISFSATCDHPPGQEPKSNKFVFFLKILNFLFISINLKADRDLYPCILDSLKKGSRCFFINQFLEILFFFNFLEI